MSEELSLDKYEVEKVDIERPPGLAGEIARYMADGAARTISGGIYAAMAIQCMSMAGHGIKGASGTKLSLLTVSLGASSSGKDRPQEVAGELMAGLGLNLYGDIRSEKDLIRSLMSGDGRCFFLKDEAHSVLIPDPNNSHKSNLSATLMEIATTKRYRLSPLHSEEYRLIATSQISKSEKRMDALTAEIDKLNGEMDLEYISMKSKALEDEKNTLKKFSGMLDRINSGIEWPSLNLSGFSTPGELSEMITTKSIDSGLIARTLVLQSGEIAKINEDIVFMPQTEVTKMRTRFKQILSGLASIKSLASEATENDDVHVKATPEALVMLRDIMRFYDQDKYRLHPVLGALFGRASMRVQSIASILALDCRKSMFPEVGVEDVKYALAIFRQSMSNIRSILTKNEAESGSATYEQVKMGLRERILEVMSGDSLKNGEIYVSALKKRLRRKASYANAMDTAAKNAQICPVDEVLTVLESRGAIESNGKKVRIKK